MTDIPAPAATAAKAVAAGLIRHVVTVLGTGLVARGYVDQSTVGAAIGPISNEILGAALVAGATGWSVLRARLSHTRWAAAWAALQGHDPSQANPEHP